MFPIPDFYSKPWKDDNDLLDPVNVKDAGLNEVYALAFGNLGAMPLSKNQGAVYVVKMPAYEELSYFSIMPYLFQSGRFPNIYPQDILFASLTDSFNLHDLEQMTTTNDMVKKWIEGTGDLTIIFITSHNKKLAEKIYSNIKTVDLGFSNAINGIFPAFDKDIVGDIPIVCLPLPAGTTFAKDGDNITKDPLGRNMLKTSYTTNENITGESPIYDWQRDTVGIVSRLAPKLSEPGNDTNKGFSSWDDDVLDQKNIFVLGVEDTLDEYEPFKLSDQNGGWDQDGKWKGGVEIKDEITNTSSWKTQKNYQGDIDPDEIDGKINDITNEMKKYGYSKTRDITIHAYPSPFPHYNRYVSDIQKKFGTTDDFEWSQSGIDIAQYNITGYGDCRDTIYPTSDTFCMGPYDVAVIVSTNFCRKNGTDIGYNNINIYDSESQTSLSSFRGDHSNAPDGVYSLAVSRNDLTCNGNLPGNINMFGFLPTGSHTSLAASTTTTFFCQSRCYMDKSSGTSPKMTNEQSRYLIRVFSPCEENYPLYCHNFENDYTYEDTDLVSYSCYINQENDKGKRSVCENDLIKKYNDMAKTTDALGSALCANTPFFRINKTTDKDTINGIKAAVIAVSIVSLCILTYFFVKRNNVSGKINWKGFSGEYIPFIAPLLLVVYIVIVLNNKWNELDQSTAYSIKQTHIQR